MVRNSLYFFRITGNCKGGDSSAAASQPSRLVAGFQVLSRPSRQRPQKRPEFRHELEVVFSRLTRARWWNLCKSSRSAIGSCVRSLHTSPIACAEIVWGTL